ncbi:MAG: efflux RND transporter periplasmic adaptor subunit [Nannocystaceae bacterium]
MRPLRPSCSFATSTRGGVGSVLSLCSALVAGCLESTPAATPTIEAPYVARGDGLLEVRRDLWDRLKLAEVEITDVQAELAGVGRLEFAPDAAYAVRVPVTAFVEVVHVTAGATVRPGDPLATLRSGEIARLRSDTRRLGATIAARRDAVDRYERLVREGAASPRELVQAQAELAEGEAELRGVRESLRAVQATPGGADRFLLRATSGGQVLLRTVDPGERVGPEDLEPAFLIGDAEKLVAVAAFPEREAAALREGGECSFTIPVLGTEPHVGALRQVVQTLDRSTRTASAVCVPEAADPRLRAEMAAYVRSVVRGEDAIVVPRSAIVMHRDHFVVFVDAGERTLERRRVRLGAGVGERIHVVDGLQPGDRIVQADAVLLDGELDLLL